MIRNPNNYYLNNIVPNKILLTCFIVFSFFSINGQTVNESEAYETLAGKLYAEAIKQDSAGNSSEALKSLERAIFLNEDFEPAHRKSGEIKIKRNEYSAAINDLNRALSLQSTPEAYLLRAQAYFELGNFDEGYKDIAAANAISPDEPFQIQNPQLLDNVAKVLYQLAMSDLQNGDTSAAFEKFDEALLLQPDFAEAYYQKGVIFYNNADFASARNNFEMAQGFKNIPEVTLFLIRTGIKTDRTDNLPEMLAEVDVNELENHNRKLYDITRAEVADFKYEQASEAMKGQSAEQAIRLLAVVEQLTPEFFGTYYRQGLIAISNNEIDVAVSLFEKANSLKPNKDAYLQLGNAYAVAGNLDSAFEAMKKAKTMEFPPDSDPQIAKPSDLINGQFSVIPEEKQSTPSDDPVSTTEATADEESTAPEPAEPKAEISTEASGYFDMIDRADAFFSAGDFAKALQFYQQAADIDPLKYYPKNRINQINELLNATDLPNEEPADAETPEDPADDTSDAVSPEIDIDVLPGAESPQIDTSEESMMLYNEGLASYYDSDFDGALEKFTRAISLDPNFADAYYNSGFIKLNQGYFEEAIADFDIVLSISPNDKAYFYKGRALIGLYKFEEAAVEFTMAIELNPDFYYAYNNRGNVFFQLGNYQAAINDFNAVIDINPDYVFAYNNRGNAYFKLENFEDALADYGVAINLRPDYGFAYLNRGITHEILGNMEAACNDWSKASELGIEVAGIYYNEQCIKE
jgi:tetratricopeptide (TPR) repeat protein